VSSKLNAFSIDFTFKSVVAIFVNVTCVLYINSVKLVIYAVVIYIYISHLLYGITKLCFILYNTSEPRSRKDTKRFIIPIYI
jgi:hypothetical protein